MGWSFCLLLKIAVFVEVDFSLEFVSVMNEIDKNKQNNINNKIVTHMCMVSPTSAEKTQARQVPLKSVSYLLTNFSLRDLGYPENSVVRRNLTGF